MITGTIRDAVGAVVPNVNVKLSSKKLKKSLLVKTNDDGGFAFDQLPAGIYTLVAEAASFEKKSVKNLLVSEHQCIDLKIQIENWSGYITVGMVDDDSYMIDLSSTSITHTVYRRKDN